MILAQQSIHKIRQTPRFKRGDRVRISARRERRHHRVPSYVKGRSGVVERVCAKAFPQPEELAYGKSKTPPQPVYRVRLSQRDLWPDYKGPPNDTLELEIYEHWLEPAED